MQQSINRPDIEGMGGDDKPSPDKGTSPRLCLVFREALPAREQEMG